VLGRQALTPLIGPHAVPFITFFPAVAIAAWFGGLGPALVALALSLLAARWFFMEPQHMLAVHGAQDLALLMIFAVACAFIVGAVDRMHRARARLHAELEERRRVETQLAQSRDLLETTLASIGDAVIVADRESKITFLNAEAARLTGWTRSEALGQRLDDVFRIIGEATRRRVESPAARALAGDTVVGLANHTLLIAKDGSEIPIDDSAAPVRVPGGATFGVVLVFRDVTTERQAREARTRLAAIVEHSGDAIFTKDLNGIITTWNMSAERLFGYRADEIVGKPITVLIPDDRLHEEPQILARLRAGLSYERLETVRRTKAGRLLHVSISVSPLKDAEGRVVGASKIVHDVTEIVQARAALARERELLLTTLASIGDAVIMTDVDGRVTFLNREAERLTGWATKEAEGRELHEVFHIVNEATRAPVENPVAKVLQAGAVIGLANHTVLIDRHGRETPIDDSAAPIRQPGGALFGVVLVFRDITERKRSEDSMRESEGRFRLMADSAPVLIWISGADKLRTWFNSQWLEFVGRGLDQELGNGWATSVHCDDVDRCLETYSRKFDAREPFTLEYRLRRHDGVYRWVLDSGVPRWTSEGGFAGYIGSGIDITERREAEEALRTADRHKDEFLAILSHELRNPLAPIRLAVAMLRKLGPPDRELQELRDIIDRQTTQLARLLDDLLDVSRITSGKIVLRKARVSIALAVSSAVESSRPLIDSRGHRLELHLPPHSPEVDADVGRLAQVFSNLLNNAAKYTERGGRIIVTVEQAPGEAIIHVRDNGVGIAPEQLPRIFVMFAQLDQTLDGGHGLGVGLALAKRLVELHGGRLEVHSAGLGKGSEFVVRLPLAMHPNVAHEDPRSDAPPSADDQALDILVADDNADSAKLLALTLRRQGHRVEIANDGLEALEKARQRAPGIVILDIGMPKLNGYEVAERIRAELDPKIMLIALTGWGQEEDKRRALAAGFDHHLTKPVDYAAIKRCLAGSRATREGDARAGSHGGEHGSEERKPGCVLQDESEGHLRDGPQRG
jgi:PAS domain S-box-containing protein